jgi:cell division protein FtsB
VSKDGIATTMKAALAPAGLCLAILYFSWHALAGEQGLARWAALQADERELEAELERLGVERAELVATLARLRPATLDLDYVEEIARAELALAAPGEFLVAVR